MKVLSFITLLLCSSSAMAQLTIENTTAGTKEYREIYPKSVYTSFCNKTGDVLAYDRDAKDYYVAASTNKKRVGQRLSFDEVSQNAELPYKAYHNGDSLLVVAPGTNGNPILINDTIADGLVFGKSVHRNEFGIMDGIFWNHNGSLLAFYRMDERMVTQYPLVDIPYNNESIAKVNLDRYPMAGGISHKVKVGIFNPNTQNTLYLETEGYDQNRYLTNISWSTDNKTVCIAEINREQNHMWFNMYDATTGKKIKTLFEEESSSWVEPCTPAKFIDNNTMLWLSERDGYLHIYRYDIAQNTCTQLTKGNWVVTDLLGYDAKSKNVIFQANKESYLCRDIYAVNINGKKEPVRLTAGEGMHNAIYSDNSRFIVDRFSALQPALTTNIIDITTGKVVKELNKVEKPWGDTVLPEIKFVDLKTADGKHNITGRLILPTNFDPSKKYPVLVYLYGGSHAHIVDKGWIGGASAWMLYYAQEGYIVWSLDNRGSENRGVEFEHATHRQLGTCESEDQMVGVKYLQSLPYVDKDRMAIHGWSFGGFMTLTMLTKYPEVFKVGIAGGPVCDWKLYEVMYGERYMDTPQENPEGYENNKISNNIDKLNAKLLLIHGYQDATVVPQNVLELIKTAVDKDKMIDMAFYTGHAHNVTGPDRAHLIKRIKLYLDQNL
ncbi:MAG: DPP IV N-terminal domain-containing protein [Bacteroidia bacterium]|nr:DPP IV N-terminal domain-containing protein [Bacteroidia bacterium]